jgi:hypothetical protein
MSLGTEAHSERTSNPEPHRGPDITVCESCPGKLVFLESGNTDGWIASDLTVDTLR